MDLYAHYPDFEIYLDAHDLCFTYHDLEIITSDYKQEIVDYVIANTCISKITDLRKLYF